MLNSVQINSQSQPSTHQWWNKVSRSYHHFFDYSTRLDTVSPSQKTLNLLHDMNVMVEEIAVEDCPPDAARARQVLLDAMDAAIHGYHAMMKSDDSRAAKFMQVARFGMSRFEKMLSELGIH